MKPVGVRRKAGHVSLERALSKLGLATRLQARALIEAGQVKVDGRVCRQPLKQVVPEKTKFEIGQVVARRPERVVVMLHKPRGMVTTRSDEKTRATVYDCLKGLGQHVVPVGRLDLATSGLLLLTNDTQLANWLTDPRHGVSRVYVVEVRGEVAETSIKQMMVGVFDEGEFLQAERADVLKASGRESRLLIKLTTGKNREIRRLCKAIGHEVKRLKRVAYGPLDLGSLAPGQWRLLSEQEVKQAFPAAKLSERPAQARKTPCSRS